MARPVNADAQATRARILTAASHLFARQGHGAVSMRAIARGAETTQATLHHYYGTKDALYGACVDAMYTQIEVLQGQLMEALSGASSPQQVLFWGIEAAYRLGRENQDPVRLVYRQVLDAGEASEPRRARAVTRFLDAAVLYVAPLSTLAPAECRSMLYSFMLLMNRVVLLEPAEVADIWPDGDVEGGLVMAFGRMLALAPA